jgi:hypothetical protein
MSGVDTSGPYLIDPDGPGIGDPAFTVDCDLSGQIGETVQRVAHLWEATGNLVDKSQVTAVFRHALGSGVGVIIYELNVQ